MRLPTIILAALAVLSLGLYAATGTDKRRSYTVVDDTTPDETETADAASCAGTLEAKCSDESSYTTVDARLALTCSATAGVDFRAAGGGGAGSAEWACPLDASAPEYAVSSAQVVTISGTLSICDRYALTAQSECSYTCKGSRGVARDC